MVVGKIEYPVISEQWVGWDGWMNASVSFYFVMSAKLPTRFGEKPRPPFPRLFLAAWIHERITGFSTRGFEEADPGRAQSKWRDASKIP
jgi:hypothetical protein